MSATTPRSAVSLRTPLKRFARTWHLPVWLVDSTNDSSEKESLGYVKLFIIINCNSFDDEKKNVLNRETMTNTFSLMNSLIFTSRKVQRAEYNVRSIRSHMFRFVFFFTDHSSQYVQLRTLSTSDVSCRGRFVF